jgi:hypothetical protein
MFSTPQEIAVLLPVRIIPEPHGRPGAAAGPISDVWEPPRCPTDLAGEPGGSRPKGLADFVRLLAFALAAYCYLQHGLAPAQDTARQLTGSWKLNSWTIQVVGGEVTEPFGPNPKGRAAFTPDEYVAFIS